VLYPFQLGGSLGYLASRTPAMQFISEGPSTQYVATR
jgi:hypothetical protein